MHPLELKLKLLHMLTTEHTLHSSVKLSMTQTWTIAFPENVESQSKLLYQPSTEI